MKKTIFILLLICGILLPLSTIDKTEIKEYSKTFTAMDTVIQLRIFTNDETLIGETEKEINRLADKFNRGLETSEIYKINNTQNCIVSTDTAALLNTAQKISEQTDGAFDVTVAPVMDLWGFYGHDFRVPNDAELQQALGNVNYHGIVIENNTVIRPGNMQIDLGGIAKGFIADKTADFLKQRGVKSAVISIGGNVYAIGLKSDGSEWSIAIQNSINTQEYIAAVCVQNMSVVTSGNYQRRFEQNGEVYHHILNPKTGRSAKSGLSSVTVICDNSARADGLSTALFVMGIEKASAFYREYKDFEAVFVSEDGGLYVTEGIIDNFNSDKEINVIKGGQK